MKSKTGFGSMKAVEDMSEEPQNTKKIQIHVTCRQYYTTCFTKCANGRQKPNSKVSIGPTNVEGQAHLCRAYTLIKSPPTFQPITKRYPGTQVWRVERSDYGCVPTKKLTKQSHIILGTKQSQPCLQESIRGFKTGINKP
jgi:hypothetical protein